MADATNFGSAIVLRVRRQSSEDQVHMLRELCRYGLDSLRSVFDHQFFNVVCPRLESDAFLFRVDGTIINACHTSLMPTNVIHNCLNYMGLTAEFNHTGNGRAPEIMKCPASNFRTLVESLLRSTPPGKRTSPFLK